MTTSSDPPQIFVWRKESDLFANTPVAEPSTCPFCGTATHESNWTEFGRGEGADNHDLYYECPLCGWHYHDSATWRESSGHFSIYRDAARLKTFDVNSPQIALDELAVHLRSRFSDIYAIDWRRFEVLVEDVLKRHGFRTMLTQASRDGGADVILLTNGQVEALVECKRWAADRTVGVDTVRELVGACVDWGVQRAHLVTTGSVSHDAHSYAERVAARRFSLDLVDAARFVEMLSVYNSSIPSLHVLSESDRRNIIEERLGHLSRRERERTRFECERDSRMVQRILKPGGDRTMKLSKAFEYLSRPLPPASGGDTEE